MHRAEIGVAAAIGEEAIALAQRASQPRAELMARALVAWSDGVLRDRLDVAQEQVRLALRLAQALGAKRFEGQLHGVAAVVALRRGDRQQALELAEAGLAVCREHGMGHIGPWLHGVRALAETDPSARRRLLEEGERVLALGCVSHNHMQLREMAIDTFLEMGDWEAVERSCERIRSYTADEPLAMSEITIDRGLALARFGRGERSAELRATLAELRERAARAEWNSALPAIEAALAGEARFDVAPAGR
jgi:hypothetical protein